jgi:hypothetical protein
MKPHGSAADAQFWAGVRTPAPARSHRLTPEEEKRPMAIPLTFVLSMAALLDLSSALVLGFHTRKQADTRELLALVPLTLVGLTLGLTLLVRLPRNATLLALGLFVCVYAVYVVLRRDTSRRLSDSPSRGTPDPSPAKNRQTHATPPSGSYSHSCRVPSPLPKRSSSRTRPRAPQRIAISLEHACALQHVTRPISRLCFVKMSCR